MKQREAERRESAAPRVTIKGVTVTKTVPADLPVVEEPSYRDLQAQAKELDIPANQTADDLKAAIQEAEVE
jgi:hypothetical protein